ncbi:MAG: PspA/IM30 family protein [Flavobacteriales bacterium]|jgi:phage shock protein A|nr:PspA/IM30 family protein [Flavobacteriales bacterium]
MSIFRRLFKIGQSEAHNLVDKLEDPIKLTEQGIRDLKKDLDASLKALAEVKALRIRSNADLNKSKFQVEDFEKKAMTLLNNAKEGKMDAAEADRLATEALKRVQQAKENGARAQAEVQKFDQSIAQLEANINKVKSNISKYENELKTLKARMKVSKATKKINKQLSQVDSTGTIAMLEKMKDKVAEEEALAEAYGDIAEQSKSVDEEIDAALDNVDADSADALAELKKKMGM